MPFDAMLCMVRVNSHLAKIPRLLARPEHHRSPRPSAMIDMGRVAFHNWRVIVFIRGNQTKNLERSVLRANF